METTIEHLPVELFVHILRNLEIESLSSAALVCERWGLIIDNCDVIWKDVCERECHKSYVEIDAACGYSWRVRIFNSLLISINMDI